MKRTFIAISIILFFVACGKKAENSNTKLAALFEDNKEFVFRTFPFVNTMAGDTTYEDRLTEFSEEQALTRIDSSRKFLDRLKVISRDELRGIDQVNYDCFQWTLENDIEFSSFNMHYLPLDPVFGYHMTFAQLARMQEPRHKQGLDNYLTRLRQFPSRVDQIIDLFNNGLEKGFAHHEVVVRQIAEQCRSIVETPNKFSPFLFSMNRKVINISDSVRDSMNDQLLMTINFDVKPAYNKLITYLEETYLPLCRKDLGVWALPNGDALYRWQLKYYTTTNWTPEQVWEMGESEIERIIAEMSSIRDELGFEGDHLKFTAELRSREDMQFGNCDTLLAYYEELLVEIKTRLPGWFSKLPVHDFRTSAVEEYREQHSPQAFYQPPNINDSQGVFYLNCFEPEKKYKYLSAALTLHEAIPGHHIQRTLNFEMPEPPYFRNAIPGAGYVEGWAIYCESLGGEVGFYNDPLQRYGALSLDLWRTCKMMTDIGIHHLKWSRAEAEDFLQKYNLITDEEVTEEIDQIIGSPAQATANKLGEYIFIDLRKKVDGVNKEGIDARAFHDLVLQYGPIPLVTLIAIVNEWLGVTS